MRSRSYSRIATRVSELWAKGIDVLDDLDAEKCLRINLTQRVGYFAVGDMEGVPYIKMCENLPYAFVGEDELDYTIRNVAATADKMEEYLEPGDDLT